MNATTSDPQDRIRAANTLGEGILWDARRQCLWWTDIQEKRLHRFDWETRRMQVFETPERVGSFGFIADSEQLITAFETGIAQYDPYTQSVDWIARPEASPRGLRFNDGRVDRSGRFWCGTMVEGQEDRVSGSLYSVDASSIVRCHVRDVRISNGLCTSPDGKQLYFADSPTRTIWVYDLVEPEGTLAGRRTFVETPPGSDPDGAAVDTDGCVWSAHWGASCVVRYTPDGRIDRTLAVPTRQPTCVCFGGPNLDLLFVTSARENLDAATLSREPYAGDVFVYRSGSQGLPEPEYRSSRNLQNPQPGNFK